jgi:hypothetical protein
MAHYGRAKPYVTVDNETITRRTSRKTHILLSCCNDFRYVLTACIITAVQVLLCYDEAPITYIKFVACMSVCSFLARQPPVGHGLLIHEVSRSHTSTHHSR